MPDRAMPDYHILNQLEEFFAAGYCECPAASPQIKYARAYRRWFENYPLNTYQNGSLYPCGKRASRERTIISPNYSFTRAWNQDHFAKKWNSATPLQQSVLHDLKTDYNLEETQLDLIESPHTVGGGGYTHAIVNYGRVLEEGLDFYLDRIKKGREQTTDPKKSDFYLAMVDLVAGIRGWHQRLLNRLPQPDKSTENSRRLRQALEQVPFKPARNFYEAMVAYNLVFYIDGCDNPGRMDQVLWPFYKNDAEIDHDSAVALLREFFDNVCVNAAWSLALGGSLATGESAYQEMTHIILEAAAHKYRPSLELRVCPDMPDKLWDRAFDTLNTGCGQPAFYNESGYLNALRAANLNISAADIVKWNGGGCTETMLHGCSNVGSLDAGINLPLVLTATLKRLLAVDNLKFEDILPAFEADVRTTIAEVVGKLNTYFIARAQHRPQPVRSLLMDDCLERGLDFNAGGARYNWSVVNVAGLANVADSLEAIHSVVFERQTVTAAELGQILRENFAGNELLRQTLLHCAKFGNDIERVDTLASQIAEFVYHELLSHNCQRGGRFLPAHIMFETYVHAGAQVAATPDGRLAGAPLSDSAGPMQGHDRKGPTAMLNSVARLPQQLIAGTPVLNMRLSKTALATVEGRQQVRALIETYFQNGGMQLQFSLLDRAELLHALAHPDQHENLVVRIGGYSTYFNSLSDELKNEVVKRTEYLA